MRAFFSFARSVISSHRRRRWELCPMGSSQGRSWESDLRLLPLPDCKPLRVLVFTRLTGLISIRCIAVRRGNSLIWCHAGDQPGSITERTTIMQNAIHSTISIRGALSFGRETRADHINRLFQEAHYEDDESELQETRGSRDSHADYECPTFFSSRRPRPRFAGRGKR